MHDKWIPASIRVVQNAIIFVIALQITQTEREKKRQIWHKNNATQHIRRSSHRVIHSMNQWRKYSYFQTHISMWNRVFNLFPSAGEQNIKVHMCSFDKRTHSNSDLYENQLMLTNDGNRQQASGKHRTFNLKLNIGCAIWTECNYIHRVYM